MNKKILLTTIALSAITTTGAYAMYGIGSMGDNEGYGWGSYMHKHGCKMGIMRGHYEQMQEAFENAPANIKAIIEKKKNGSTLTDTEKQTLRDYMKEHRPPNMHAIKKYKDMIEKKYGAKLDAMSAEQLTNLQSKIKTLLTKIKNSSNYTEEQKILYSDVLTALDMSIKDRLQKNDAFNILDSLFNK